jgi:hypothetical protein
MQGSTFRSTGSASKVTHSTARDLAKAKARQMFATGGVGTQAELFPVAGWWARRPCGTSKMLLPQNYYATAHRNRASSHGMYVWQTQSAVSHAWTWQLSLPGT